MRDFFLDDKARAVFEMNRQGFVFCFDREKYALARKYLRQPMEVLREEVESTPLSLLFLYDQERQSVEDFRECDGRANVTTEPSGAAFASIAMSTQALAEGEDYFVFLFAHELAHLMLPIRYNHEDTYHSVLDFLLDKINKATGKKIKNDYLELPESQKPHKARERAQERSDPIHM